MALILTIDWLADHGISVEFRPGDAGELRVVLAREGRTLAKDLGRELYSENFPDCCAAHQVGELGREFIKILEEDN